MQLPEFVTSYALANVAIFIFSLALLIFSSHIFVDAAASLAKKLKVSEIVIGLTLVSIGTSLPELATSLYASVGNLGEMISGTIFGSNIVNVTFILGAGIMLQKNIAVERKILFRDIGVMMATYAAVALLGYFGPGYYHWTAAVVLLGGLVAYMTYLFKTEKASDITDDPAVRKVKYDSYLIISAILVSGLVGITLGAKAMVDTSVWGADQLDISREIVAATIVAIGTSLPELAVTLVGIFKKHNAIALGNVIGSCTFNILLILGICSAVNPVPISGETLYNLLPWMLGSGALLALFLLCKCTLYRWQGAVLVLLYAVFALLSFI